MHKLNYTKLKCSVHQNIITRVKWQDTEKAKIFTKHIELILEQHKF